MRRLGTDRIDVEGIAVPAIIGIFDWERKRKQKVVLSLSMETDARRAARRDAIEDALDYKTVSKRVQEFVRASRFRLLESLAEAVARILVEEFGVRRTTVRVEKPGALRGARTVAVTISRGKRMPQGTRGK